MKQKKTKGLLIVVIIIFIILIIFGIIACVYFLTDLFKSNKQLFFKYTAQIVQSEDGFINSQLMQYFQKKNNSSYENNGNVTFEVSNPETEYDLQLANNFNVTFSGKENPNDLKSEKEISLNYSNSVNFPLTYRKTNNIIGIQTQYLGNSFVAVRDEEEIPDLGKINSIIKLQDFQISNEQIQNLKTTYFDNIFNTLADNKFAKLTDGNLTGYKLTLTGEELKNLVIQILETLKSDIETLEQLNILLEPIDEKISENNIEDFIEDIQDIDLNNNIEITIYATAGNLKKVDIRMDGNVLTINKQENNKENIYTININSVKQGVNIIFTAKYSNFDTDSTIENYEMVIAEDNDKKQYTYKLTNNVQFKTNVEIENLAENNAVILNDKDDEYVENLLNVIEERITEVNKKQMEELGVLEDENPVKYLIPSFLANNQTDEKLDEQAINSFNAKFELYQNTNTKGATVKGLLTTIQNNNEAEGNKKIEEINFDGEEYEANEQNITLLKSGINVEDAYRVEFEKDSNTGLIYRAVINKR